MEIQPNEAAPGGAAEQAESLARALVSTLNAAKWRVATAESCTGGMLAQAITAVAGASAVFDLGVVAYANRIKEQVLGVAAQTLAAYGAVSAQTAKEMAEGVRLAAGADLGISTTGIAGPGGGTAEKPVGLVYIGIATASDCVAFGCRFAGDRQAVRTAAVCTALQKAAERLAR